MYADPNPVMPADTQQQQDSLPADFAKPVGPIQAPATEAAGGGSTDSNQHGNVLETVDAQQQPPVPADSMQLMMQVDPVPVVQSSGSLNASPRQQG